MKKQYKIFSKSWNQEITLTLDESLNNLETSEASKRRVAEANAMLQNLKHKMPEYAHLSDDEWKKSFHLILDDIASKNASK